MRLEEGEGKEIRAEIRGKGKGEEREGGKGDEEKAGEGKERGGGEGREIRCRELSRIIVRHYLAPG